jgi:hypothetical protein
MSVLQQMMLAAGGLDQYTKILLHMNGTNGSTSFPDAAKARTWTTGGGATVTTGNPLSGFGESGNFGGWIETPDETDFTVGSGDFTVDFWFRAAGAGAGTTRFMCGQVNSGNTVTTISVQAALNAANGLQMTAYVGSTAFTAASGGGAFSHDVWNHFAGIRDGGTLRTHLNGVQVGSVAISGTVNDSANKFSVGRCGELASNPYNGQLDEFRLSVGKARWVGGTTFTPPSSPYG